MESTPSNYGVEQSLLGALVFDNRQIDMVQDKLSEESFYANQHKLIWKTLLQIRKGGGIADAKTLLEFFAKDDSLKKIGGEEYLTEMVVNRALAPELEDYAALMIDLENRRGLIEMAQIVEKAAVDPKAGVTSVDIATDAQKKLSAVMIGANIKPPVDVKTGSLNYIKKIRAGKESNDKPFISTGIRELDRRLGGGLFPEDLIVLGGRPSMGKTALALAMMHGVGQQQSLKDPSKSASSLFFSIEMSEEKISSRMMTLHAHAKYGKIYNSRKMRSFEIEDEALDNLEQWSQEIGDIHIDDRTTIFLKDIRIRANDHIRRIGHLDFIVVDYLTLMQHEADVLKSRGMVGAIGEITKGLKQLCRELGVTCLLLAQLSRQVEQREDKRPQLSDLRESGNIEQDADTIIFCYRDEYYEERNEPRQGSKNYQERHDAWRLRMARAANRLEMIFSKNRYGPVGVSDAFYINLITGYVGDMDPNEHGGSAMAHNPRYAGGGEDGPFKRSRMQ